MVSWERVRDELRSKFWLVPAVCVVVAIGTGAGLIALDHYLGSVAPPFLYPGPPSGARSFLSSITQAMIAFTGLVFSITIVVLALTSGQFSPRVLRAFLRDRTIQVSLGVFVSTFVYSMVVQRSVTGSVGHHPFVPRIAVTGAFVLVLASVALFIHYIDHVANMIRAATIVMNLGNESRALLERRYPAGRNEIDVAPVTFGAAVRTVGAPRPGVVVSVNEAALLGVAARAGCIVEVVPRVGDFVPQGAPLFRLHPDAGDAELHVDEDALMAQVAQDNERTMEQDLAFGFRQLVDIAERALSPSTNDPTTACQAIDVLHDLLRRLATRSLPTGRLQGADGSLRVIVPRYSFNDFVDLALEEIWNYGSDAAQVPGRLATMLADLSGVALPENRGALSRWAAEVGTVTGRSGDTPSPLRPSPPET